MRDTDPMGDVTKLLLIRHGDVGEQGILHGQVDVPLTSEGEARLRKTAQTLQDEPITAVYSSDLIRAQQSAQLLLNGRKLEVSTDPAFRELHMGSWDGRKLKEVWQEESEGLKAWWKNLEGYVLPGGESMAQLRARVLPALDKLIAKHRGETIALAAHGGVNRVILFEVMGLALQQFHTVEQRYGCINRISYFEDGNAVVNLING